MNIILAGPGRAGMSLALASRAAGHEVAGVLGRESAPAAAELLGSPALSWDELLPAADLLIIGVRDDAIAAIAERLAPRAIGVAAAVHLSGSVGIDALDPLSDVGLATGGFHPLQSLPDPDTGARRLAGSWAGITVTDSALRTILEDLATSLGMTPFDLPDGARRLYHAGASAAANYVVGSLVLAERLFAAAGVPWEAARPLIEVVIENTLELGPAGALTGPIARGDTATVDQQLAAIRAAVPELEADFANIGRAVAHLAGRTEEFRTVFG
ncbi:MAG: DUF2520 domain-containing protein [Acidimicrobiia bacterium]|nr:DUF2520 domain-containing protein [Acidimicrobiia bacterium]